MSAIQFDNAGRPVSDAYNFQFQDLAKGFQGVDENGVPVPINPGKLNFDPSQVRANAHGGTIRFQQGGTTGAVDEATHWRAQDMQPVDAGVVGSARAPLGMPRPANELRPGDLVTLPGPDKLQVTASVAARLGYLRQLPSGGYSNTHAGEPPVAAPTPAAQARPAAQADPLSTDVPVAEFVGHVAVIQRGLPEVFVANAISEMVQHGQFSPEAIHAAAKHLDTSPEIVLSTLQGALKAHGAAYERYVSANGVRPADFTAFMQNQPETLALLMAKQASTGRTSVWAPMLRQFRQSRR